jgi:hypothetical protein
MATERQLIERMREAGRTYLRKNPGAFGGGIDPNTGIRFVGGKRVSVLSEQEKQQQAADITAAKTAAKAAAAKAAAAIKAKTEAEARIRKKRAANEFLNTIKLKQIDKARKIKNRKFLQTETSPKVYRINPKDIAGRTGTLTRAMDIGGGEMQDFVVRYVDGKIVSSTPIGIPIKQTKRFKQRDKIQREVERQKKEALKELEKEKPIRGRILPLSTIPIIPRKKLKKGFISAIDFVSGGALTERNLNKRGEKINEDIENFNKRFGNRELTEEEARAAQSISESLRKKEENLSKDRDKLASSAKSKIAGFISPIEKRRIKEEEEKLAERSLGSAEKKLSKINLEIEKKSKKKDIISKINLRGLRSQKKDLEGRIKLLKVGEFPKPKVFAGEFPIIPAVNIPSGIRTVKFIGTQKKGKGGKVITDLVFKTDKGRVGIAKGVSVTKGEKTASVVLGRSGKLAFKFPTRKAKVVSVRSFIGKEVAMTKATQVALKTKIKVLSKAKKVGTITKIKKNINALQQVGVGKVASVKGKKFIKPFIKFPTGKIGKAKAKGILMDDFASISAIFTKKELSLIVGKSITRAGAKSRFIGLIKGTTKPGKKFILSATDKQQFGKALRKVVSATSAALSQSKEVSGLTKAGAIVSAYRIAAEKAKEKPVKIKPIVKVKKKPKPIPPKPTPAPKPIVKAPGRITRRAKAKVPKKPKVKAKIKAPVKVKARIKRPSRKPVQFIKAKAKQKQEQELLLRLRQKLKQRQKLQQKLTQKLTQKQQTKLKQKILQIQKQILKLGNIAGVPFPTLARIRGLKIPKRRKKRKRKVVKPTKKKLQAYSVYARPLRKSKKAKRPKLIKVSKVPLRKKRAKDMRNYIVDTSLSRTAKIKKTKGKPKPPKLKIPSGYAKRTSKKFRRFRVIKGKRRKLPKGKVIEKSKSLLDTKQEKKKITLRKRIKQITKKPTKRKIIKRKITMARRKQMLSNLAKARRVRAANLGRQPPIRRTPQITMARRKQMLSNLAKARAIRAANLRRKRR